MRSASVGSLLLVALLAFAAPQTTIDLAKQRIVDLTHAYNAQTVYWPTSPSKFTLENLTNLDALPARGATVIALPMKIEGGSGGPVRVVALVGR